MRHHLLNDIYQGTNLALQTRTDLELWPEVQALGSCKQDPHFHGEGNVLIHTEMVLEESLPFWKEMGGLAGTLRLACLLHDIEKPQTTIYSQELQHTIAPGHERRGGITTRYLLHQFPSLSGSERRLVADLVTTHHLVKRAVNNIDQPAGPSFLDSLAECVDTRLLWALEMADMKGRICTDQAQQIETVELFRMLCEERGIFGHTPISWLAAHELQHLPFQNESQVNYVVKELHRRRLLGWVQGPYHAYALACNYAKYHAFEPELQNTHLPAQVIITLGISGSGKSTAIDKLSTKYQRLSSDATRRQLYGDEATLGDPKAIFTLLHEELRQILRVGGCAVYDATNIVPDLRAKVVNLCHDYGAMVTFWVFDVSLERALQQNKQRSRQVPEAVIRKQAQKFEWPLPTEYHDLVVIE